MPTIVPNDVGVAVHGPLLLSQAPGIRVALSHVQAHAHPVGVMLHLHLSADGVQAEAAKRQMVDKPREPLDPAGAKADYGSEPVLHVQLNDLADRVPFKSCSVSTHDDPVSGDVHVDLEASYWIGELPADGRVRVRTSWPQAGLPHVEHLLVLELPTGEDR
ncbi:hypothetical protein GTR02_08645 [Kineococcus sp. R8]|nr:hypothetical protein [Kineococcus siccus]